jgi:hypothetical protein
MVQVVEHFPSNCKALSSNSIPPKKKEKLTNEINKVPFQIHQIMCLIYVIENWKHPKFLPTSE